MLGFCHGSETGMDGVAPDAAGLGAGRDENAGQEQLEGRPRGPGAQLCVQGRGDDVFRGDELDGRDLALQDCHGY